MGEIMPAVELAGLFFLMAVLYAAVGQGGGSGYLAAMALLGVSPENFRLVALVLNVVVASISLVKFARAGHFDARLLLPFLLGSVPLAFLGGLLSLPGPMFRIVVGVVLLWAAVLLIWRPPVPDGQVKGPPPPWAATATGGVIGLLSGLVGIGGGVFLAPCIILRNWASTKQTAALSSGFILVNSLAALLGVLHHTRSLPALLPAWMAAVALGGWFGAEVGARRLSPVALQRLLAVVLVVAGCKIALSG